MNSKTNYFWLLALIPLFFTGWYFLKAKEDKPLVNLPIYEPKKASHRADSVHTIPNFEFTNQFGEITSLESVKKHIYVAEFFFTTCQSICPMMNENLQVVYREFQKNPEVLILSHTVDPETDSVAVLKEYADSRGVTDRRWLFLTGDKIKLYDMARQGYLLDDGPAGSDHFVHTQKFALIDKEQRIRGFYDGTDSMEVKQLVRDIKILLQHYRYAEKRS